MSRQDRSIIFDLWDTLTEPDAQLQRHRLVAEVGALVGADGEVRAAHVRDGVSLATRRDEPAVRRRGLPRARSGGRKPDPRFYHWLLQRLEVVPRGCVYVPDGRSGELAAAARLGLRSIRIAAGRRHPDAEEWTASRFRT